jgi:hypothetical protein
MKAAMYEESSEICNDLTNKNIEYTTRLRLAATQILGAARIGDLVASSMSSMIAPDSINKAFSECHEAAVRFVVLIERRQIIDPKILVFRTVMNATLHDMRESFQKDVMQVAWRILPSFSPDGRQNRYTPLSEKDAQRLHEKLMDMADQASDIGRHIEDFLVEMQNLLLGDLFGHQVAHRTPLDPRYPVTTLATAAEIERRVMLESNWGKLTQRIERDVLAGMGS